MTTADLLLRAEALSVHFPLTGGGWGGKRQVIRAVDAVDLTLGGGEILGVVGESGCGKSTLGRALLRLVEPTAGRVLWRGEDLSQLDAETLRRTRHQFQMIFQDPLASLDPRMSVGRALSQPLETFRPGLSREEQKRLMIEALARVGLPPAALDRYPHEFSGGQCQRIGIARALLPDPRLIVCDEAVSALDVSTQAQIINLLAGLRQDRGVALLFISHNLAVIRQISDRVMVLYLGKAVEVASRDRLFARPRHPYTAALVAAVPTPDPRRERARTRVRLSGELPSPLAPPSGCRFHTRCPLATPICAEQEPPLRALDGDHLVACHHADQG